MSFGDFDLATVREQFGLTLAEDVDLFASIPEREPREFLRQLLSEWTPAALAMNTEKARSEFIIAPILMEMVRLASQRISLFSGIAFDVDRARGMSGTCDYLIARSPERYFINRPVVAVVEAKRDDIFGGLGQCAATMVGVQIFNARKSETASVPVFGVVTSGTTWRFLKLDGATLTIDLPEYYLQQLAKILGILTTIVA